jgi:hypothetical protein
VNGVALTIPGGSFRSESGSAGPQRSLGQRSVSSTNGPARRRSPLPNARYRAMRYLFLIVGIAGRSGTRSLSSPITFSQNSSVASCAKERIIAMTDTYVYRHKRATWPWSRPAVTAHKYPLLSSGYIPNANRSHSSLLRSILSRAAESSR